MKKLIVASTIVLSMGVCPSFAVDVDSEGYVTQLFPPLTEAFYTSGTPSTLNSSVAGEMIHAVAPGETLRLQFVVPPGATVAGVGGTSNFWNSGGSGKQPIFGFFNCTPGNASVVQSQLFPVSGGYSPLIKRPDVVSIDKPFFSYLIISNPSANPYTFTYGRFTQNVSFTEEGKPYYSSWVDNGRLSPTVEYPCGESGNLPSTLIGDYSSVKYGLSLSGLEQGTFNVGDTVEIHLTETDVPFRSEPVDLWAAIQTPSGEFLYLRQPLLVDTFKAGTVGVEMFSTTPQPFKRNVTASEKTQYILNFQAQAGSQGQYIFYVLYMEAGKNPLVDYPSQTFWRSSLMTKTITIQ